MILTNLFSKDNIKWPVLAGINMAELKYANQ